MIREKISEEMRLQKLRQSHITRLVNKLNTKKTLTQTQLCNFLSGKKGLSIYHIESIFEVLGISLIRIL